VNLGVHLGPGPLEVRFGAARVANPETRRFPSKPGRICTTKRGVVEANVPFPSIGKTLQSW
jgi:hypothetical protein